jgi:DNA-binding IclR family transcriptional regulator
VREARRKGHASSAGELQPGAFGIAAPILVTGREAFASIGVISLTPLDAAVVATRLCSAPQAIATVMG